MPSQTQGAQGDQARLVAIVMMMAFQKVGDVAKLAAFIHDTNKSRYLLSLLSASSESLSRRRSQDLIMASSPLLGRISGTFTCASSVAPANTTVSDPEPKLSSDKVSAVLFDMDGVLCNSEERSRLAGVDLFAEMGVQVMEADFFPFMGTGSQFPLGRLL
ncbi:hypothetical protein L7F22_016440 [Adiantum nelumboides]|nr:hypothetical protein [Adiantum nelumboides]